MLPNLNSSFQRAFFLSVSSPRRQHRPLLSGPRLSPQTLLQSHVGWDCFAKTPISKTIVLPKVTPGAVVAGPGGVGGLQDLQHSPHSLSPHRNSSLHILLLSTGTKCSGIPLKVKCSRRIVTLYCGHIAEIHLSLAPKSPTSSASVWCRLSRPD